MEGVLKQGDIGDTANYKLESVGGKLVLTVTFDENAGLSDIEKGLNSTIADAVIEVIRSVVVGKPSA